MEKAKAAKITKLYPGHNSQNRIRPYTQRCENCFSYQNAKRYVIDTKIIYLCKKCKKD